MKRENATKTQQHYLDRIALSVIRIIIGVLVGMQVFVPIIFTYFNIYHSRMPFMETPEDYDLDYTDVEFKSADGLNMRGWFIPASGLKSAPGVLLIHGFGTNRSDLLDVANVLHKKGYSALLFDLRAHGLSDGDETTFGIKESNDIKMAFRTLSQQKHVDEKKLGIYAVSMGASMAIIASAQEDFVKDNLKAIFLDSPYSQLANVLRQRFSYSKGYISPISVFISKGCASLLLGGNPLDLEPLNLVKDIEVPMFLVHGSEDRTIPSGESESLLKNKIFGIKNMWMAPLSGHLEAHKDYQQEYETKLVGFFDKYLK